MEEVTLLIAFFGGLVAFLSPCMLPLIPAYLGYLAGTTLLGAKEARRSKEAERNARTKIFINAVLFVVGFSAVFALLGVLLSTVLVGSGYAVKTWLSRIGGALIILFGLYLTGLFRVPWLSQDHGLDLKGFKPSYLTSIVFGASFAVGWTPCIGPVLGSILALTLTSPGSALALLFSFALGFSAPLLVVGAFTAQASRLILKAGPWLRWFDLVVGLLLILLGLSIFFDAFGGIVFASFYHLSELFH